MRKQYIEVPLPMDCSPVQKVWQKLVGLLLMPYYLLSAWFLRTPGTKIHIICMFMAIRLFLLRRISLHRAFALIFYPMDSTRYFEFHEVIKSLKYFHFNRYLDVSSPRLMPLILLKQNKDASGVMINPDVFDIQETTKLIAALELTDRCILRNTTIEMLDFPEETFDLLTCLSVLEHIPSDESAVKKMWSLLQPGGKLILTLPCKSELLEQYISRNDYGVLSAGADGYTFWQRYYDSERLESTIYRITGMPARVAVYGEKKYGLFFRNAAMKRLLGSYYPFWREPYMMATEYRAFSSIDELPGEGVAILEFIKPAK